MKYFIKTILACFVNMLAGEEIHLADGFHAKAGSNFHAGINPNMCTDGGRVSGGNTGHEVGAYRNKTR